MSSHLIAGAASAGPSRLTTPVTRAHQSETVARRYYSAASAPATMPRAPYTHHPATTLTSPLRSAPPRRRNHPTRLSASSPSGSDGAGMDGLDSLFDRRQRGAGQVSEELLEQLSNLPLTDGLRELQSRAYALSQWKAALSKGVLPDAKNTPFPDQAFSKAFTSALKDMEMARFTRKHPALLDSLLKQMLTLVKDYEEKLIAAQAEQELEQAEQPQQPPPQSSASNEGGEGDAEDMENSGGNTDPIEPSEEEMKEAMENAKQQSGSSGGESGKEIKEEMKEAMENAKQQSDAAAPRHHVPL